MQYTLLGNSDLTVSNVSFGCMSLGNDHNENAKLLHEAFDAGINYFDTANIYQDGFNEETVGHALNHNRDKIILATKVGNIRRADGSGLDWNATKAHILKSVDESLARLQTTYIDLYQLHGGMLQDPIDETIEAFELLKQAGKIRHYGISSIRPNVIREYVKRSSMVSVMMQYSLLDRRPEETCFELLQQHNISVVSRGTLTGGLLINKPSKAYLNYSQDEVEAMQNAVKKLTTPNRDATAVVLQFVLAQQAVTSSVLGIRTSGQLQDCLRATQAEPLTSPEIEYLKSVLPPNPYQDHR